MQVICIDEPAFYHLIDKVLAHIIDKPQKHKWISESQAMELLNIKSKTTLQRLRDGGKIRFSQPQKKIILYDQDSIEDYLNKHAKDTL